MKRVLTILMVFGFIAGFGQAVKLEKASQLMEDLNYSEAIKVYNEVLEDNDLAEAKLNLAKAYRMINDTENAEYWYGQTVRLPESNSIDKLYYAQMLQINGKCNEAKPWFSKFSAENPGDHRGQLQLKSCDSKDELMRLNQGLYEVNSIEINSGTDDFGATFYEDGIIFSSERDKGSAVKRVHTWTGDAFLELFYADLKVSDENESSSLSCKNFKYGIPKKFNKDINHKFHDAQVSFSNDGQTMMFTRNNWQNGKTGKSNGEIVKLKIFEATKSGEDWSDVTSLPFNSDEYSTTHPALSPDGNRLFFASDMPGGFGGMDLYMSSKDGGRWGPPFNLGPLINTEGNELFPFYGRDGQLYFSSNGQIGLGGLDLYSIEDLQDNQWGPVTNLGFPINSTHDDFAMSFKSDMTSGFFSSSRSEGKGGDDIYCFVKNASPIEIFVFDQATGEAIAASEVINECTGRSYLTNEEGKIIVDIANDTCCNILASKEMYNTNEASFCTRNNNEETLSIGLARSKECYVKGHVFDQVTGQALANAVISLQNACDKADPQSVITDSLGYYMINLSSKCCYTIYSTYQDYIMNPIQEKCTDCIDEDSEIIVDIFMNPSTITSNTTIDRPNNRNNNTNNSLNSNNPNNNDPSSNLIVGGTDVSSNPNVGPSRIIKDVDRNIYVDSQTREPANLDNPEGISYVQGKMYFQGREIESENAQDFGFDVSPSAGNYAEGEPLPYLLHIYYDFDQSDIRSEATSELMKLCTMLKQNPDLIVELSSHTDARGSRAYNMRLSQRRADEAVRWLIRNCGINEAQLIPRGYGESKPMNSCKNTTRCSEEDHQRNRRTEFRVIGCIGEKKVKYSEPKINPRVDPCLNCSF